MAALLYPRIALTARSDFENKNEIIGDIATILEKSGAKIFVDEKRCDVASLKKFERYQKLSGFDLIVVVGGDGTILRTVKEMEEFSIPLLTINRGTVGFLTELDTEECADTIPKLLRGEGHIDERQMLSYSVIRNGKAIITGHALNEVVVSQGAIARLIKLKTMINGLPLTTFRADGIIISTPTGSTAYNLAAGGAILHPSSIDTIITPINAHTLSQKSLAIPATSEIDVEVLRGESKFEDIRTSLTIDGQTHYELHRSDHVGVTQHPKKVQFLRRKKDTFYETLRDKLGWGE